MNDVIGGLIFDLFKIFFSDHNVMFVIFSSVMMLALLYVAADFFRKRW